MKLWHAIEVEIARVGEAAATAQLWDCGTTGIEISDDHPEWITLRAWFEQAADETRLRAQIVRALQAEELPASALRRIESLTIAEQDWLAEWKKGYEPIAVGERLLIVPSWKLAETDPGDRLVIQIDPGMAFGTGTHETTRGCLELLERYLTAQTAADALLDVGTGTGILAIAACKLAPRARVVGFDIDPEAVTVALENAEINGVADQTELEVSRLSAYAGQDFAIVLANLTADVIIPLADEFPLVMRPGGVLIASGILTEQGEEVKAAMAARGLSLLDEKRDGEWVSLALRNAG